MENQNALGYDSPTGSPTPTSNKLQDNVSTENNSVANAYAKGSVPRILNVSNKNIMKSPNLKILGGMRLIARG
jgi:hypothetical protein